LGIGASIFLSESKFAQQPVNTCPLSTTAACKVWESLLMQSKIKDFWRQSYTAFAMYLFLCGIAPKADFSQSFCPSRSKNLELKGKKIATRPKIDNF
jgi:hypothetical protein